MEHKPDQMPSRDATLNEQMAYFDAHPEAIQPGYLNNFRAWIPGGWRVEDMEASLLDTLPTPSPNHTELWSRQTPHQFIDSVAETIRELHIDDPQKSLIQLYLALRAKGYSHYDLVA
jgi:hypothetical protein